MARYRAIVTALAGIFIGFLIGHYTFSRAVYPSELSYVIHPIPIDMAESWESFVKREYWYDPKHFPKDWSCDHSVQLKILWPGASYYQRAFFAPGKVIKFYVIIRSEVNDIEVAIFIIDEHDLLRGRFIMRVYNSTGLLEFRAEFFFKLPEDMVGDEIRLYVELLDFTKSSHYPGAALKECLIKTAEYSERIGWWCTVGSFISATLECLIRRGVQGVCLGGKATPRQVERRH